MTAGTRPAPLVPVLLSCGHVVDKRSPLPKPGDKEPCATCPPTKRGPSRRTVKEVRRPAPSSPGGRTSGSSTTEGPPPRCPGVGQEGLDGPGTGRCPICTQDAAPVRRDGTLGSHKLLRPRDDEATS